jgi:hypothetical protein
MTSWSQGNNFTAAPGLPLLLKLKHISKKQTEIEAPLLQQKPNYVTIVQLIQDKQHSGIQQKNDGKITK